MQSQMIWHVRRSVDLSFVIDIALSKKRGRAVWRVTSNYNQDMIPEQGQLEKCSTTQQLSFFKPCFGVRVKTASMILCGLFLPYYLCLYVIIKILALSFPLYLNIDRQKIGLTILLSWTLIWLKQRINYLPIPCDMCDRFLQVSPTSGATLI